jgi:hypothetical protein
MGILKSFFNNVFHEGSLAEKVSSFEQVSEGQLEAHLGVTMYNGFELTDAVRPYIDLKVVPSQGFRNDVYHDEESKSSVPVLMGAASKPYVFEVFMELLDPLGPTVDVVLETRVSCGIMKRCLPTMAAQALRC